jgi:hypothetical protein
MQVVQMSLSLLWRGKPAPSPHLRENWDQVTCVWSLCAHVGMGVHGGDMGLCV